MVDVSRPGPSFQSTVSRGAAEILVGPQRRVDVGQPVEGVEARRGVVEIGGDLRVLPVRGAQRRRDARDHLRVAFGALPRVVDRQRDRERCPTGRTAPGP